MRDRLTVVGAYDERRAAQQAVEPWRPARYREGHLSVLAREGDADNGFPWSMGMPFAFLPLFGPAWAGGLMASALVSTAAASSATALGLLEALLGLGLPESRAKCSEKEIRAGRTLVPGAAPGHPEEARVLRDRDRAPEKSPLNAGTPARPTGHAVTTGAAHLEGSQKVQVREEELHVHKRPVQTGEVRIYKDIVTEQQTLHVPVMREEIVVERRPVSGEQAATSDIRPGEVLRIPIREEEVRVEKQAVVKEEVWVGKRQVHDTREFSGEVRKEKVHIEREGSAGPHGTHPPDISDRRESAPVANDQRHPERGPERQGVPPSEAENLRRWRESGAARQWVAARQGQWGHAEWVALLESLRSSPFWPMQPDAVGAALEEERRDWLAGKEDRTGAAAAHLTTGTTPAGAPTGEGQTVQVHEEQLRARKQPVETGAVRVRKDVVTEQQTLQVPVTHEEVVVERRPASGRASAGDIRSGEEIRIPVQEEKVQVEKEAVLKEEVSVDKRTVTDTEQVSGTVRKEQVKVEQEGDVDVRGSEAGLQRHN